MPNKALIEQLKANGAGSSNDSRNTSEVAGGNADVLVGVVLDRKAHSFWRNPGSIQEEFDPHYRRAAEDATTGCESWLAQKNAEGLARTAVDRVGMKTGETIEDVIARYRVWQRGMSEAWDAMERASMGGSTADIEQSKLYDQGLGYIARYAGHKGPDDYDRGGEMTYKQAVAAIKALPIQKWEIRILLNQLAQESALKSTPDDEESIHPVVAGVAAIVVGCFACAGWTWWVELTR